MISIGICSSYVQFLRRGKLLTNKLIKQDYQQSVLKTFFVSSVVDTVTLSANKIFHWVACWLTFFILIFGPWFISLFSMDFSMINRIICSSGFCMVPHCVTSKTSSLTTFSLSMYKACTLTLFHLSSLNKYFKRRTNDLLTLIMPCNM